MARTERNPNAKQRILELAADGLEYKQIAAELGYSVGGLKRKAKQLCDSMGADNMRHAIALGFRRGLLKI